MRLIFIALIYKLIYLAKDVQCADSCYCGFGGPCRFHRDTHKVVPTDCSQCAEASKGLYKNCNDLLDHCESNPCANGGKCVATFGGFFCRCPKEFYGHMCETARRKFDKFEVVSGPRVWYQVNRVWGGLTRANQLITFLVESPGDGMVVHISFDDGRSLTLLDTDLRLSNEKQKCLEAYKMWPMSNDPKICETLPDGDVYSTKIHVGYFDDQMNKQYGLMTARIEGRNVSEGRLDDIHFTVLNWRRITYSQYYRIHSVFDIWPKCLYKINFFGCSVNRNSPVLHGSGSTISLKAIRVPITNCGGASRIKEMKWYVSQRGINPFLSPRNKEQIHLDGKELGQGVHNIDYLLVVEGRPLFHGHPDKSYNYGRCWIKIVLGEFKVGLEGGNSVSAPCIRPVNLRIFSYNRNYHESNFASIWRCNVKNLDVCSRQRFLGPKLFFRTLPCGVKVQLKAIVVDVPTGRKALLTATVETSIHIDTLYCSCTYNCYPSIIPTSPIKLEVKLRRYSSSRRTIPIHIKWAAFFGNAPWGIERYIVPETEGTVIEIPAYSFYNLTKKEIAHPILEITASRLDIYCTIVTKVSIPMSSPLVGVSIAPRYVEKVDDSRYKVFILKHTSLNYDEPFSYVISEAVTPNSALEVVGFILGNDQEFTIAKMQYRTYITFRDQSGTESPAKFLEIQKNPDKPAAGDLKRKIKVILSLALSGNDNDALTEMLYISRTIASSKNQTHTDKMWLMEIMSYITARMDLSANNLVVCSQMNKVLNTINRLMLITNLTDPPFNISVDPWKLPPLPKRRGSAGRWINMFLAASESLHSIMAYYYYHLIGKKTSPNDETILELMFDALLKFQLAISWQEYVLGRLHKKPVLEFQKRLEAQDATVFKNKAVDLLMKAIDIHADGYAEHINITRGTTTAAGFVRPAYSVSRWSGTLINVYQNVRVSVNVSDETISDNEQIYFGVFVEILMQEEITPQVHIFLFTHLTQRQVKGTIYVQMNTTRTRKKCDITHCTTRGIGRSDEATAVSVFKLELYEQDFNSNNDIFRQVEIRMMSQANIKAVISKHVPGYSEVVSAPSKRDTDLMEILNCDNVFLGVLPGNGINPEVPIPLTMDTFQFLCVQKMYDIPTSVDNLDSKVICQMVPTFKSDWHTTTCSCSGSGVIETYEMEVRIAKILVNHVKEDPEKLRVYEPEPQFNNNWDFVLLIYPGLFLLVVLFAAWRDRVTWKREFIQQLADTFPDDSHPYIVCVVTGTRFLAGTRSHVAFQLFGMTASSRVHILSSKSYRVLGWGQDDWFMVFTSDSLGKLTHLAMWQDFSVICSSWYCRRVVVYDVKHQSWYKFNIEKWFTVTADLHESRITVVTSQRYIPEKYLAETFRFNHHYWRELKNTHSLVSPLTKQRRFVHSYLMRACLALAVVLTVVSMVILMDHYVHHLNGVPLDSFNVIAIAVSATLIASIPYTIASFFFTRSLVKMKKTKTLDLGLAERMLKLRKEEIQEPTGRQLPAYSIQDLRRASEFTLTGKLWEQAESVIREKSVSRKSYRLKKARHFRNPFNIQVQKWMACSIYRPIRVEDYGHSRLVVVFHVCGWVLVIITILANITFITVWLIKLHWLEGRNGILVVSVAIAIELVRSSIIVLLLSCYSVYYQKMSNFEANCLDLSGLQNNAKIVSHRIFLIATTKSYYHPLKTNEVQALYEKKRRVRSFLKIFCFLFLCIGMILPTALVAWKKDTENIYRVRKSTCDVYREAVWNNYTNHRIQLKEAHSPQDLFDYLLGTLMPASRVYKWYNSKMMRSDEDALETNKKKKYWFVDRSSKLYRPATARFLFANNHSKVYVATPFKELDLPIFAEPCGHYDSSEEYKTTYNRWHVKIKKTKGQATLDKILTRGVTGVTGIFYPSSVGEELFMRRHLEPKDEGVRQAVKRMITNQTRAIIIELSIIHPLFSPETFNSMFGVTIINILFENCASGPYTGSIKSTFFFAKKSINYLRFGILFTLLSSACIVPICISISHSGFSACAKRLLIWMLFFGSISCILAAISNFAIHSFINSHELSDSQLSFQDIVWLKGWVYGSSGFFFLLGTTSWSMWWAELTGMSTGKFDTNIERLGWVYLIYLFLSYCIGILMAWETDESYLDLERLLPHCSTFLEPTYASFIVISSLILWPLQIGVTIGITESYLRTVHIRGDPLDLPMYPKRYYQQKKKIWFPELLVSQYDQETIVEETNPREPITNAKFDFIK